MTTAQQPLHSQIAAFDEGEGYSNIIAAGRDSLNAASAIRFELPEGVRTAAVISAAVLNLYCRTAVMYEDYRIRIGVPANTSQTLPENLGAITAQAVGSETRTLGNGTFTPPLDHTIGMSESWVAIDVKPMLLEAIAAGRLVNDRVVFTIVPTASFDAYWTAHGLGNTNPPTLDLDYADASPPPDPEIATPANSQTRSQADAPQPAAHWTAAPANSQTRSQGSSPQPIIVGVPAPSQTRSHASPLQPISHWIATPADAQTRSQADSPQPDTSFTATPANTQTRSQADAPQPFARSTRRRSRSLFPVDLFPQELLQ